MGVVVTGAAELAVALRRRLHPDCEVLLIQHHLEVVKLEAAAVGPASRWGTSALTTVAARWPEGLVTCSLPACVAAQEVDSALFGSTLELLCRANASGDGVLPVFEEGHFVDWTGRWDMMTERWERRILHACGHLNAGEIVEVTLQRTRTELYDSVGHHRSTTRHRAEATVIAPAYRDGMAGWQMTVPIEFGRRPALAGLVQRARMHTRVRAAAPCTEGGRGYLRLGPVAAAEALLRWGGLARTRGSGRKSEGGRVSLECGLDDLGHKGTAFFDHGQPLPTARPATWRVAAGDPLRASPRRPDFLVTHVADWLSGADSQTAEALVAGMLLPHKNVSDVRVSIPWCRLEAAVRQPKLRGPCVAGLCLQGRDIQTPWLDLGVLPWRAGGHAGTSD